MSTNLSQPHRGHLAMLAFSLLIAGSFSLGSRIANMMDPVAMMALRFFISGVIIGAFAWGSGQMRRTHFAAPWRYVILGGLFAGYFALMFEGLKTAAPVSAAAVFTLVPLMSAGFGLLLMKQRLTKGDMIALLIGAAGAVWVIFGGSLRALLSFDIGRGEMVYFVGCVLHAIYAPMVPRLNRGEPILAFSFGMIVAGFLILGVLGAPDLRNTDWAALPSLFWIGLFYVSICASAITFVLLQYATMRLPSAKVMAYTYLTPTWVVLWELALTGVLPPLAMFVGVALTVVSVLLLLVGRAAKS